MRQSFENKVRDISQVALLTKLSHDIKRQKKAQQHYNCYFLNSKLINYGDCKSGFGVSGLSSNIKEMQSGFQMNLQFAYDNSYITYSSFIIASLYSKLKYFRRFLIINFIR